jgi:hypothetical protein
MYAGCFEHLPLHSIWLVLNSIGHTGTDTANWQDDVVSAFIQIFVLDRDMQLFKTLTIMVSTNYVVT